MEQMQMNKPDIRCCIVSSLSKDDVGRGTCEVREQQHYKSESYFGAFVKASRIFRSLIYMWMTDTRRKF